MNALKLTRQLLEDDEEDPKAFLSAAASRESLIARFPAKLHRYLAQEYIGPSRAFLEALVIPKPEPKQWQLTDAAEMPTWPHVFRGDPENDPGKEWETSVYTTGLMVADGQLYVQLFESIEGWEAEVYDQVLWGSPEHEQMRRDYGRRAYAQARIDYYQYVLSARNDPLGWFNDVTPRSSLLDHVRAEVLRLQAKMKDPGLDSPDKNLFVVP